jgi:hypothetical protein
MLASKDQGKRHGHSSAAVSDGSSAYPRLQDGHDSSLCAHFRPRMTPLLVFDPCVYTGKLDHFVESHL